eukprot:XP_001708250.1 Hypothetical protein GL50803_31592 [Giardia lamblia ATCC 50803]
MEGVDYSGHNDHPCRKEYHNHVKDKPTPAAHTPHPRIKFFNFCPPSVDGIRPKGFRDQVITTSDYNQIPTYLFCTCDRNCSIQRKSSGPRQQSASAWMRSRPGRGGTWDTSRR